MSQSIKYKDVLEMKEYALIDLRTPKEFNEAHIPHAYNLPILSDEEHHLVGKKHRENIEESKLLALEFASQRLPSFYEALKDIYENRMIIFYCSRGNMRSSVTAATFSELGLPILKLENGYKGYRRTIREMFPALLEEINFITLYGHTGVGKTKILEELSLLGEEVLDLEGCANHRGSLLGDIGLGVQNSQKQFESDVFDVLYNRKSDIIFTEGESRRIGHIIMEEELYSGVHNGMALGITAPLDFRVEIIKEEYLTDYKEEELITAIKQLSKYISKENIKRYIEEIKNKEFDDVIKDLMLHYYDKNYKDNREFSYEFVNQNHTEVAKEILKTLINEKII